MFSLRYRENRKYRSESVGFLDDFWSMVLERTLALSYNHKSTTRHDRNVRQQLVFS